MKSNRDVRCKVEENGLYLWELAEELGVSDASLSRKLRRELPLEEKRHIFATIERMVKQRKEVK